MPPWNVPLPTALVKRLPPRSDCIILVLSVDIIPIILVRVLVIGLVLTCAHQRLEYIVCTVATAQPCYLPRETQFLWLCL